MYVSVADFIINWERSGSMEEFVKATGMPARSASSRACALRRKGVKLKKMRTGPRGYNVKELNQLVEQEG